MIYSMTGYGKGSIAKNKTSAEVEVKSVNSRFFEVSLKLPSILFPYDYEIREFIKTKLQRGKVSVVIHFKKDGVENGFITIDENKLSNHLALIKKIKKAASVKDDIRLEHLLSSKEIFTSQDAELSKAEFDIVKSALNKALDKLILMKKKEGAELSRDLSARIENILSNVTIIETEFRKSINEYHNKLKQRIQELTGNVEVNEDRLNLELALIADRADITEECVRLRSHLKFFKETLKNEKRARQKIKLSMPGNEPGN